MCPVSSTVIQDIEAMCKTGNASMAYFYFDFPNANKQRLQDLVPSLLTQLSARLAPRCDILSISIRLTKRARTSPVTVIWRNALKRCSHSPINTQPT
jgi:hypothetical protein